jgi:hypothetical protein
MNDPIDVLRTRMQQKLGHCMMLLQEYERQLKLMLVRMSTEGSATALQADQSRRSSLSHKKTLGQLLKVFTADYLVSEAKEAQASEGHTSANRVSPDESFVSLSFRFVLPSARHAGIKEGLAGMIRMRNDLVHHLLERFDLSRVDGCAAACDHLDACHDEVERQLRALQDWADRTTQLAGLMSAVLNSQSFETILMHGIENAHCEASVLEGVVSRMKWIEAEYQENGWTCLESATKHMNRVSPDETPRKYGCRTWRQVLARSGHFELRVDKGDNINRGRTWYRSRAKDTSS